MSSLFKRVVEAANEANYEQEENGMKNFILLIAALALPLAISGCKTLGPLPIDELRGIRPGSMEVL